MHFDIICQKYNFMEKFTNNYKLQNNVSIIVTHPKVFILKYIYIYCNISKRVQNVF